MLRQRLIRSGWAACKRAFWIVVGWLAVLGWGVAEAKTTATQGVEAFYAGRTINLIVGYGPGGGYDVYGRLLARHMGRFIPGKPAIVVQNMPGAGSLVATNYLYRIAPKDGTVLGTFARNMPVVGLIGSKQSVQFNPMRFTWLGTASSFGNDAYVLIARKTAQVRSIEDLKRGGAPPLAVGSTAEGASSDAIPVVMRELLGLNVKTISGYTDSSQLFLAIERGEIEGRMVGLSAVRSNRPAWLKPDGPMHVLLVFGRQTRHQDLPEVPIARELAPGPRQLKLIEALEVSYKLARPFAAPPGVPADRGQALQRAFMAALADKDLLQDAERLGIDISPLGAQGVIDIIKSVAALPADTFKAVERLIEGK